MKYLRTFESIFSKYNIGDYIVDNENKFCKITSRIGDFKKVFNHVLGKYNPLPYSVEYLNGDTANFGIDYIKRKMTPEEIEQFEIEKEATVYNL